MSDFAESISEPSMTNGFAVQASGPVIINGFADQLYVLLATLLAMLLLLDGSGVFSCNTLFNDIFGDIGDTFLVALSKSLTLPGMPRT